MSDQLDLFAAVKPRADSAKILDPDPLVEKLVGAGFAPNDYLLNMNRALYCPVAMDLPSRLFQWPVEFVDLSRRPDHRSALLLNHPAFAGMPFVDEIEARCGERPVWEPLDEFGRERAVRYRCFHAMDLLTDEHWQDFISTRHFTDHRSALAGMHYRAVYGGLSADNMRAAMRGIGEIEPDGKSVEYLASDAVQVTTALQGIFVGLSERTAAAVWACVHGLETKKFKRDKSGFLRFAPAFLAEKSQKGIAA